MAESHNAYIRVCVCLSRNGNSLPTVSVSSLRAGNTCVFPANLFSMVRIMFELKQILREHITTLLKVYKKILIF